MLFSRSFATRSPASEVFRVPSIAGRSMRTYRYFSGTCHRHRLARSGYTEIVAWRRWYETMSLLAKIRSGQARWGHASLALLTFAWLNVVLQPCAMAMSGGSGDSDHLASGHVHEQVSHGDAMAELGHAMVEGHANDHGDLPGDETQSHCTDCSGDLAGCAHLSDINKSERAKQSAPDQVVTWLALPAMDCAQPVDPGPPPVSSSASDAARLSGAFPPLNVLYCVYLD